MKNKIMTFEEEKRLEKIKSVYSTVFIISVFVFVIRLFGFFVVNWLNGSEISPYLKLSAEIVFDIAAIFLPFAVYGKIHDIKPIPSFKKKSEAPKGLTALTAAGLCGAALFLYFPSAYLIEALTENGFVFYETYPVLADGTGFRIFYLVLYPLLFSAASEFVFRGVVLENIKSSSAKFSVLTVIILNVCLLPSWHYIFLNLILAVILSFLYIRTSSVSSVFIGAFLSRFVFEGLKILSYETDLSEYAVFICGFGLLISLVSFVAAAVKYKLFSGKKYDGEFTVREGFKALFGNSSLYLIIFVAAVQVFCFYVNRPEDDTEEENQTQLPSYGINCRLKDEISAENTFDFTSGLL